ncbi:hypothetical protein E2C01_074614 [Portunus trituberculatus]|uniref:Uncharacterized protein n=1 Tax=Portunus trituberculatus TaxID=210409 RepID=A0A5B7I641_PORTR|nr:hypothetical protein [Portunus trituberculatus]
MATWHTFSGSLFSRCQGAMPVSQSISCPRLTVTG